MPYAVLQDMLDRYGGDAVIVTFDRDGSGVADPDAVERAIADAGDEIDGYLAGRYSLPIASAPRILTLFCCDIAMYRGAVGATGTEEGRKRYEDAVKYLQGVASGRIALLPDDPSAPDGGSGASFVAGERLFTRKTMRGLR